MHLKCNLECIKRSHLKILWSAADELDWVDQLVNKRISAGELGGGMQLTSAPDEYTLWRHLMNAPAEGTWRMLDDVVVVRTNGLAQQNLTIVKFVFSREQVRIDFPAQDQNVKRYSYKLVWKRLQSCQLGQSVRQQNKHGINGCNIYLSVIQCLL